MIYLYHLMSLPLCSPLPCHSQLLLLHWVACHCPRAAVLLAAVLRWKKGQSAAIRIAVKTWKSVQEKTKEYIIQQIRGIHIVRENTEKIQEMGEKFKTLKTKLYRFILFQLMQFVHSDLWNTSELPVGI